MNVYKESIFIPETVYILLYDGVPIITCFSKDCAEFFRSEVVQSTKVEKEKLIIHTSKLKIKK